MLIIAGDDTEAKDLFKRPTRDIYSYFWPTYDRRADDDYTWWYYPKRAPGSEFLGKRAPGSEFLGKRAPGSEFLGKRVPGSEFLGKRAPGSEFLGKRVPGSEFLGKRVPGSEFLGKRRIDHDPENTEALFQHKRSFEVPMTVEQRNDRHRFEEEA